VVLFPKPWLPFLPYYLLEPKAKHTDISMYINQQKSDIKVLRSSFLFIPRIVFIRSLEFYYLLHKKLRQTHYDLIHAHWVIPSGYATSFLKKNIPIIITAHAGGVYKGIYKPHIRIMLKKSFDKATFIISVAKYFKKFFDILKVPSHKIRYIPNGVDTNKFKILDKTLCRKKLNLPIDKTIYLYIGNLYKQKGAELLITAFKNLMQYEKNICLVIAGTGPLYKYIEAYVNEYKKTIFLFKSQPYEKVPIFLNAADFFVLPSKAEGNPVTVLESLCCGTPVLASNIPALRDIIKDKNLGILFERHLDAVFKAMQEARLRHWNRYIISEYGKRNFSWDVIAEKIYETYIEAIRLKRNKL